MYELRIWVDGGIPSAESAASENQCYLAFLSSYQPPPSAEADEPNSAAASTWQHSESMILRRRYFERADEFTRFMLSNMGVTASVVDDLATNVSDYVLQEACNPSHSGYVVLFFLLEVSERPGTTPDDDDTARVLRESAEQEVRTVPATESSVEALKEMSVDATTAAECCTICLEELSMVVTQMPCSHVFHKECIVRWLQSSHSCPLCRYAMPTSS
ncbi:hypothetical protein TIFTF001_009498 [Ficus carica]|uniref:RING-type E3 ubiquitin transferase n=1 Tax=Ficus carica TaxID=3494 RepID=A0AA88CZ16_FICCA|nr:hypothetical protein TIFTF001_009498 [Ficus carica]